MVSPGERGAPISNGAKGMTPASYRATVLAVVRSIPPGRVMTYGSIAAYLADATGRASPRLVGQIMAHCNEPVPWPRVIRSGGRPAAGLEARALALLRAEGTAMRGPDRVDMRHALWAPDRPPTPGAAPRSADDEALG